MARAFRWVGVAVVAVLTAGGLTGDDKPKETPARVRGTLPTYFSKLGLSDEQKQKIHEIQAEYKTKIEDLEKQVKMLKNKQRLEISKVLTEAQKARLKEILAEKAGAGAEEKPAKEEKKPDTKPGPNDKNP
jgi:hypothetical protein